ncbi:dioxygenase family protein [Paenibacillus sp. S33]
MTLPSIFVAHGSPTLAVENNAYTSFLAKLGASLPRPKGIVIFSAHWDSPDQCIGADDQHAALHDFYGFPEEMYSIDYPAPGDPKLYEEIKHLFSQHNLFHQPVRNRGLDHGAWVVLRHIYPDADIPVVPLSIDSRRAPQEQYEIGRMLAPLREQGILIIGSGGLVHNLRTLKQTSEPADWAVQYDDWIAQQLQDWNLRHLFQYDKKAPYAKQAVPSYGIEHFSPLFYAMGAADLERSARKLFQSYVLGSLSLNCWAFGQESDT